MNPMVSIEKLKIPTYPEPPQEPLPMFAENRVHQRTSGRPYPNKVVLSVDRSAKFGREYTVVRLENEYLRIEILPEIGGRIYSALDKTTGYDFFYKQHVIKPALIGVLGSWISGGVEFNWPFHHRASGFMPCDYTLETQPDGAVICWLSEHDPIDRMKGMVGIVLRPGEARFETRMRLYNRTDTPHSFLWWENAAVPVNEQYRIFFPQDVTYVNFHYLKSRTTYPIAGNCVFDGIPMAEPRDISWHKNTREATSYFASASQFDFFGGYDYGKACGVVHIGDHHVSPGKKMFTWAYGQLSKTWESALTDTDGQYAELMAGSYSDNQPNFAWLAPYETKHFSQYWYPIAQIGTPEFANLDAAFRLDRTETGAALYVQATRPLPDARIRLRNGAHCLFEAVCSLNPAAPQRFDVGALPQFVTCEIESGGRTVLSYTERVFDAFQMPDPITDMPAAAAMGSADDLYLAGVHVDQYRDPAVDPDAYWREALRRNPRHIPSLIAMAEYAHRLRDDASALRFIRRAVAENCQFNTRVQSGTIYYVYGQILESVGAYEQAADWYHKAAWAADSVGKAMTRIAMLDVRAGHCDDAVRHAETALDYGRTNNLAAAVQALAIQLRGDSADDLLQSLLRRDPLDHFARFLSDAPDFYDRMESNAAQTCLDLAADLDTMGQPDTIVCLLDGLVAAKPSCAVQMIHYARGYYRAQTGGCPDRDWAAARAADIGPAFPIRPIEQRILESVTAQTDDPGARLLLGCLYYHTHRYAAAAGLWAQNDDWISVRNLAVAKFSHLHQPDEARALMARAVALRPDSEQLVYETAVLMDKCGVVPAEKIAFLTAHSLTRDDSLIELAKAYNQADQPDDALRTLLGHTFVACEGGEHAIADQYMFAHLTLGRRALADGRPADALDSFRAAQVLPQSLGAGLWNRCKLVPARFCEATALEQLGRTAEAQQIFRDIADIEIEYFSNMNLKELPYFQAYALCHLGEPLEAQKRMTKYAREWAQIADGTDNGYFATTPFFLSFVDDPSVLRKAQSDYLTALSADFMGDPTSAAARIAAACTGNSDNLLALSFRREGFLR